MELSLPRPTDRQKARAVVDAIFGVTDAWRDVFGGHFTDELHWQIFYLMMVPPQPFSQLRKPDDSHIFPFTWLCDYLPRRADLDYETLLARIREAKEHGLLLEGQDLDERCFVKTDLFREKCRTWANSGTRHLLAAIAEVDGQDPDCIDEIDKSLERFMNFWDSYGTDWSNALGEILKEECFPLDDRCRIQKQQFSATRWHIVACAFRRVAEMADDEAQDYISIGELVDRVTQRLHEPPEKVVSAAHDLVTYGILYKVSRPGQPARFALTLTAQSILTKHFSTTLESIRDKIQEIECTEHPRVVEVHPRPR